MSGLVPSSSVPVANGAEPIEKPAKFLTQRAGTAQTQYRQAVRDAEEAYKQAVNAAREPCIGDLKAAQDAAMQKSNLEEANRIDAELKKLDHGAPVQKIVPPVIRKKSKLFTVDARKHHQANVLETGMVVKSGQRIVFFPSAKDRWHPRRGQACDYRGVAPPVKPHLRMHSRLNEDVVLPIVKGMTYVAPSNGEIELFCWDEKPQNNEGAIRVKVTLSGQADE